MVFLLQQSQLKYSASRHYSREMRAHGHPEACSGTFPAALKGNESTRPSRGLFRNIPSSTTANSPDVHQQAHNRPTDEQTVAYPHNGILLSNKEGMRNEQLICTAWTSLKVVLLNERSQKREHILLYDVIYMKFQEMQTHLKGSEIVSRWGMKGRDYKGLGKLLRVKGVFSILILVVVSQMDAYVKHLALFKYNTLLYILF